MLLDDRAQYFAFFTVITETDVYKKDGRHSSVGVGVGVGVGGF
jgi:hypothetical protein